MSDLDNDGILNDNELNFFQVILLLSKLVLRIVCESVINIFHIKGCDCAEVKKLASFRVTHFLLCIFVENMF